MKYYFNKSHLSICNQGFAVFPGAPDAPPVHSLEGDVLEDHILGRLLDVDGFFRQSHQDDVGSLNISICLILFG